MLVYAAAYYAFPKFYSFTFRRQLLYVVLFEHVSKQRTFGSIFREMRLQLSRRLLMNFLTLY